MYTASIAAGLEDTVNTVLASDYTWSFTIALPTIVSSSTGFRRLRCAAGDDDHDHVQPADGSCQHRGRLRALGPNGLGARIAEVAQPFAQPRFHAQRSPRLRHDLSDHVRRRRARGRFRRAGHGANVLVPFTTVLPREARLVHPGDGGIDVDPYGAVVLYFNSPMDVATLDRNVSIEPKATLAYTYWNEVDFTYAMSFDLMPGTTYTLALEPGMLDPMANRRSPIDKRSRLRSAITRHRPNLARTASPVITAATARRPPR